MSSQTFRQNVEPEKRGEMTQMPKKKFGNSFQTFRKSANILTPLSSESSESSMHVDPCLSLLCFHGFFRNQVRFCSQLCHNPLNLHMAWEFLYVVTSKQAFSNRPTKLSAFSLCCLKGNSACGMVVENTRSKTFLVASTATVSYKPSTCSKICQKASSWMNWKIRVAVGPICRFLGNMQRMEKAEHHGHGRRKVARRLVWMPLRQKLSYHAFLLLHVTSIGHMNKASSNMHVCTRCLLQQASS